MRKKREKQKSITISLWKIVLIIVIAITIPVVCIPKLRTQVVTTVTSAIGLGNKYAGSPDVGTWEYHVIMQGNNIIYDSRQYPICWDISETSKDNVELNVSDWRSDLLIISGNGNMHNFTESPWYEGGAYENVIITEYMDIDDNFIKTEYNRISINEVWIENEVTNIGNYVFSGCSSLTNIRIPNSVTRIGNYAFDGCSSLISIEIPSSVTSIGIDAFAYCTSLTYIEIPSSVTSIDVDAFDKCDKLTIFCESGSTAEQYAKDNNIRYILKDVKPTITISPNGQTGYAKTRNVTITVADLGNSGLSSSNSYQYYLSTSSTTQTGGKWTNYTSGTAFTIGNNLTGTYYLHVKSVSNNTGNNSGEKVSGAFYFDNTVPIGTVTYSLSNDKASCTVTITSNEEIQNVSGWTLSSNKMVLTREYTTNTSTNGETITIKDLVGNSSTVTVKVTGIEKIFETNVYKIKGNYIRNIEPAMVYINFIKNIKTNMKYTIKEGNEVISGTSIIKTGQILTVEEKNYVLVVTGDINGDGEVKLSDLSSLKQVAMKKATLEGAYKEAADVNGDGEVKLSDLSKLKLYILGETSL